VGDVEFGASREGTSKAGLPGRRRLAPALEIFVHTSISLPRVRFARARKAQDKRYLAGCEVFVALGRVCSWRVWRSSAPLPQSLIAIVDLPHNYLAFQADRSDRCDDRNNAAKGERL
jgi:hypothetical protein